MKLQHVIAQYVSFKRALGERCQSTERMLMAFSRAMGVDVEIATIEAESVTRFLNGTGSISRYWHDKYGRLLNFYRFAISRGFVASSPLPAVIPKRPERFVAYIYTHAELRRLFDAASTCRRKQLLLEPHTLRTILLLLYGAGLRVSEALSLKLKDVDFSSAVLTIRQTKFYKTRLVPLGPQLNQAMAQYAARRRKKRHLLSDDAPFFMLRNGVAVPHHLMDQAFKRLRAYAAVSRTDGGRYQPRMHDLRHSFAVHRLTAWYQEGTNVQKLLPQLSTYLGHINIAATQVYLTMTPELLQEASLRFGKYAFQEVSDE